MNLDLERLDPPSLARVRNRATPGDICEFGLVSWYLPRFLDTHPAASALAKPMMLKAAKYEQFAVIKALAKKFPVPSFDLLLMALEQDMPMLWTMLQDFLPEDLLAKTLQQIEIAHPELLERIDEFREFE